jgi:hypothetical protein
MTDRPLAEKAATCERPVGSDPRDDVKTSSASEDVVSEDTLVARPDLGEGAYTFVAAGDRVPAGLESNKRSHRKA